MPQTLADAEIERIPIEQLKLDAENPRLWRIRPADGTQLEETEIVEALVEGFDPEPIGRSIVEYGFFVTEPLIVFPEGDHFIVAEGNRRLVSLKLLLSKELRDAVDADDVWDTLAAELEQRMSADPSHRERVTKVPCQVVADRDEAAPVIGYRHIVGILKWNAYEKAAYVVSLLRKGASFEEVSDKTGEKPGRVRRYFRDVLALEQAHANGLSISRAQDEFGRWERAMTTAGVRSYIGAVAPGSLNEDSAKAYEGEQERMGNLLSFLYGEEGGPERLFSDTRRIDQLATALASEDGRKILEDERDLDRAYEAAGGLRDFVLKSLQKALTSLQRTGAYFADYSTDQTVIDALEAIEKQIEHLREGAADAVTPDDDDDDFDLEEDDDEDAGQDDAE